MTAPLQKPAWQRTWLWETLQKRAKERGNIHASEFMPTLTLWMRDLDSVLSSGGTSPLDFTLHDANHSLRVANRIEQLLTTTVRRNLSDYELALLLLAAYGHDIGMTPERGKVLAHHRHLFGHPNSLVEEEKQLYQTFLDEYPERPITLPLGSGPADHDLADELTAYYVRERHNDWSAEWLRENLKCSTFGHLPDVVNLLVRLCSSHHWDFTRLQKDDFEPLLSNGSKPQLIHLRFLACLLRLADILENDPERTPHVLYEHRAIEDRKKSLIFWRKDHSFTVDIRDKQLHFQARPPDAHVHKATVELADWIDHELHGIASLGERMPVHNQVGKKPVVREWHLPAALTRDIRPADDSYEYIEGAFRPNTARLLQLLSNEQLYGSPLVAVRELLQNAFDAVREKIARLRLDLPVDDVADRKYEQTLGDNEKVTLTLRSGEHGRWLLVCEDSGVGLSKALITGHLLVSGNSRRHAILDLERRCTAKGFPLGRTGQFGIGVLSYFMLAEQVELTTTRSQLCGDNDAPGWTFTTRGVGSFGELRQLKTYPFPAAGTRIVWLLKPEQIPDPAKFANRLWSYLEDALVRIPCRFEFKTESLTDADFSWKCPTGWVKTVDDWKQYTQTGWKNVDEALSARNGFLNETEIETLFRLRARFPDEIAGAERRLRCEFREIPLPDNAGMARLVFSYFDLDRGRSLVFNPEFPGHTPFEMSVHFLTSWQGMKCHVHAVEKEDGREKTFTSPLVLQLPGVSVEYDLNITPGAVIEVSREGVKILRETTGVWIKQIAHTAEITMDEILGEGTGDFYTEINLAAQQRPLSLLDGRGWFQSGKTSSFGSTHRPMAIAFGQFAFGEPVKTANGQAVQMIAAEENVLRFLPRPFELRALEVDLSKPESRKQVPCALWSKDIPPDDEVLFPPEWQSIAAIRMGSGTRHHVHIDLINHHHPLIGLLSKQQKSSLFLVNTYNFHFWENLNLAKSPSQAVHAICQTAIYYAGSLGEDLRQWQSYSKEKEKHLEGLWKLLADTTGQEHSALSIVIGSGNNDVILSPYDCRISRVRYGERSMLPLISDPDYLLFQDS